MAAEPAVRSYLQAYVGSGPLVPHCSIGSGLRGRALTPLGTLRARRRSRLTSARRWLASVLATQGRHVSAA